MGAESKSFEVYVGCDEWQDVTPCSTKQEAEAMIKSWRDKHQWTMGAYTATNAWIKCPDGSKIEYLPE